MDRPSPCRLSGALPSILLFCLLSTVASGPSWAFERTETRADCADFDPLRTPFFGDTHVHTRLSFDGATGDIRTGPRDAYLFAKGDPIELPPYDAMGVAQRSAQLARRLDFVALSDHAEFFGEVSICLTPSHPEYDSDDCHVFRSNIPQGQPGTPFGFVLFVAPYLGFVPPARHDFCGVDGSTCLAAASPVWIDIQDAAEEHYDRSASCTFTTFVGYEYSGAPTAQNIHRNVIFRNDVVPALPTSFVDEPTPQGLWAQLQSQCLDALPGCDVLAIPHNSNLSNGLLYTPVNEDQSPIDAEDAAFRARMEPLVEIMQHKGDSECREGVLSNDELCGFEKMTGNLLGLYQGPPASYDPLAFVRNVLKEGLAQEEAIGDNPYQIGIIASTDTHNSTPGLVREDDYAVTGHLGTRDGTPQFNLAPPTQATTLGGYEANGGGLAVLWAEENSRDALFEAMVRREAYGTSGTRPTLRFFAGRMSTNACDKPDDFAENGYQRGVPMGGEIGAVRGKGSPRFAVLAVKDPGASGEVGTPLQRVQIVKGWIDAQGEAQEQVFEVAGDPNNGASVDPDSCVPSVPASGDFDSLCTVWEDPGFDREQRAFYYARVIENPTCRWTTLLCNDQGIDCSDPGGPPAGFAPCCNPNVPKAVQERAWSSPVFYRPEGIRRVGGNAMFAATGDVLKLRATMHRLPASVDPSSQTLEIEVNDDDAIVDLSFDPGTLTQRSASRWELTDTAALANAGLAQLKLIIGKKNQGRLILKTVPSDLSALEATDHEVRVRIRLGDYEAEHRRRWTGNKSGTRLRPKS